MLAIALWNKWQDPIEYAAFDFLKLLKWKLFLSEFPACCDVNFIANEEVPLGHPSRDSSCIMQMLLSCTGPLWTWWSPCMVSHAGHAGAQAGEQGSSCGVLSLCLPPGIPLACPCSTKLTYFPFLRTPSLFAVLLQIKGLGCMWRLSANE